jgi:hypothetical protein
MLHGRIVGTYRWGKQHTKWKKEEGIQYLRGTTTEIRTVLELTYYYFAFCNFRHRKHTENIKKICVLL